MFIVSYDFQSNKRRAKFSKFLEKYGHRIQYSVFELRNSGRVLDNVMEEIKLKYEPNFTKEDSIVILTICEGCKKKIERFGYAANEEEEVVLMG